jgi:hypothetical protein
MSAKSSLLAALLLCASATLHAEEPASLGAEEVIEEARPSRCAVLWAPAGPLRADAVADFLAQHPGAKPTIAVSPDAVDAPERMSEWASQGRIELALRIEGDPILPLIGALRPEDAVSRIVLARGRHQKVFGQPPKGLVPGGGAFSQSLTGIAAAQGLRWVAVGDYLQYSSAPWMRRGETVLAPVGGPSLFLLDPLTRELPTGAEACAATASEAVEEALKTAEADRSTQPWTTWTGPLSQWADDPDRKPAWDLYTQAAEAVTQYQNSGRASLSVLDKAVAALYAAQDSRFFRSPPSELDQRDLAARLKKVYRYLGLSTPSGLGTKSEPGQTSQSADSRQDSEGDAIRSGREGDSLWFEVPQDSATAAPESLLRGLRVSWDAGSVAFELTLSSPAPAGSKLDIYVDINHRAGAGSIDLLPERSAFLNAADAWEYALTIAEGRAVLYRFVPGQGPVPVDKPKLSDDPRQGIIRANVSRGRLRGNPAAWGYAALLMRSPEGPLDVLAVSPTKRKPAAADSRYRRFSALRLGVSP